MENINEVIKSRRSIRKFSDEEIPDETIREIVQSALYAPSACNSQCYHFIAVKNKQLIEKIAVEIEKGIDEFYSACDDKEYIARKKKQILLFRKAPLVIFVCMTEMEFYDSRSVEYYNKNGFTNKEITEKLGSYDVLSVGAAVENMLLTIHSKGLGACWMNEPLVSSNRISNVLNIDSKYKLLSVIPVGKSEYKPFPKTSKSIDDILEIK